MTTEITVADSFTVRRVSKAGKVATRGIVGVLTSGNKDERAALTNAVVAKLIANNTFAPVMAEMVRVFPLSALAKVKGSPMFKAGDRYLMETAPGTFQDVGATFDAATTAALCRAVAKLADDKELKGEKLLFATYAADVLAALDAKAMAKAEAEAAAQAAALLEQ